MPYDWNAHFRGELRSHRVHGDLHGSLLHRDRPKPARHHGDVAPLRFAADAQPKVMAESKQWWDVRQYPAKIAEAARGTRLSLADIGSIASVLALGLWGWDHRPWRGRR